MRVAIGDPAASSGGAVAWPSDVPHFFLTCESLSAASLPQQNYDILLPFVPPADVTIKSVNWMRVATNAANVYVGIYNNSGTLLTDCAVDTGTTTGLHEVSTTHTDLTAGNLYWYALNQSSSVANIDTRGTSDIDYHGVYNRFLAGQQPDFKIYSGGTAPTTSSQISGVMRKSRTNAALLSTITLSGFEATARSITAGVTPV